MSILNCPFPSLFKLRPLPWVTKMLKLFYKKTKFKKETEMIGKEDHNEEEEPLLKVTDKRKFNEDGSLRDGVNIEKEEPKPVTKIASEPVAATTSGIITEPGAVSETVPAEESDHEPDIDAGADEKNPASFVNFLSTLVTNAAAALGAIPHPVTGEQAADLESGKYWIDVLTMLREKTKGNLSSREDTLLANILSDLQMQFVSMTRDAEETLKAQAAQKFSSKDILGG